MRRALAIAEKNSGPEHPNVATALITLAHLLEATNRFAEAEPFIRRALVIHEKSLGPDHPMSPPPSIIWPNCCRPPTG